MLKVLKCVKKHKIGSVLGICLLVGLVLAGGYAQGKDKKYLISDDFREAVQKVSANYFFSKPLPPAPKKGTPVFNITLEDYHKNKIGEHYQALGDELCQQISKSYRKMIGNGIKGKHAYRFDEALTETMREAGAFVLPLRVTDGLIKATYYNPDWRSGKPDSYGNIKGGNGQFIDEYEEYARKQLGGAFQLYPKEEGKPDLRVYVKTSTGFRYLYDFAVKQHGFETIAFETSIDFVHGYLFIFDKDPDDLNAETIFFYVDLPYHIRGKKYGEVSNLTLKEKRKPSHIYRPEEVTCRAVSESALYSRGMMSPSLFITEGRALAPISDVEPLTIPLHKKYGREKVVIKPGFRGMININYDDIAAEDMAEPSLRCWMLAMGYVQGDYEQCRNTGYATEFMKALNSNICVWKDKITKAPELSYPYTVHPGYHEPDYADGGIGLINRCSPDPYRKPEGK